MLLITHSPQIPAHRDPWNKGKLVGPKPPFKLQEIWAIRIRLEIENRTRELALFNLAIDSKLRGCDLVRLKVSDVMRTGSNLAVVQAGVVLRDVMFAITKAGAGAACVTDEEGKLAGIITDGDVRRALLDDDQALAKNAEDVMIRSPRTISPDRLATEGLRAMEAPPRQIGEMPVLVDGRPVGMLMLKDLVAAGIV